MLAGIDIGGSGTKISIKYGDHSFSPMKKFENDNLFSQPNAMGTRLAEAINSCIESHHKGTPILLIGVSITGEVNHNTNILIRSDRLNDTCGYNAYSNFDFAEKLEEGMTKCQEIKPKVFLLNDGFAACLDPNYSVNGERLVLTLTLGTWPAFGLLEKISDNYWKVYDISSWSHNLRIGTADGEKTINQAMNSQVMNGISINRARLRINRVILKILPHYLQVFNWQPNIFVILGGVAGKMESSTQPQKLGDVKIIYITNNDESNQSQIRGALCYAEKKSIITITNIH